MRKVHQFHRVAVLLAGASLTAIAVPAFAAEADDQSGLEEITVTAQKREQNLQDVPLAISAIGSEKIDRLSIHDSRDLSGLAPNVTVVQGTTSAAAAVISIRGISAAIASPTSSNSTPAPAAPGPSSFPD